MSGQKMGARARISSICRYAASHTDDPRWLEWGQVHLKPLARDGRLDLWDDTRIEGGGR